VFITEELRQAVKGMLAHMEEPVKLLETLASRSDEWHTDTLARLAAERALHIATESMTDAANLIIDTLIMRDPGSYPDIIRVLAEEEVVSQDWFNRFEGCLLFRNRLVHQYREVSADEVREAVRLYAGEFSPYIHAVKKYLGLSDGEGVVR
jgi:uncharacterized protein YutE (UPF0331/DUF86 family)